MTEGEYRVGVSFNPSKDSKVDDIKAQTAAIIDMLDHWAKGASGLGAREAALAMTHYEDAAMWAVKAFTKPPREQGTNEYTEGNEPTETPTEEPTT